MLSQPTLPANPEEPLLCPPSRAPPVVGAGWRHRKNGASQLYRCNGCGRRFSPAGAGRLRTPPAAILEALCLPCQGQTFPEILLALRRRHRV
ncbi:MAG: hypothetical protein K9N49_05025, partial [Candidatus Marinimicrobia bacterium]|nr:hypothetical protein [Candidatus Neomarinimicrobiota bacterium]